MEHATPANVREFLDRLQASEWQAEREKRMAADPNGGVLDLTHYGGGAGITWESQLRHFFSGALEKAPEESAAELWLFALEMAYFGIEELDADAIGHLFD